MKILQRVSEKFRGGARQYKPGKMSEEILKHAMNTRRWDFYVSETIINTTAVFIESDPWLAEHYADENLIVCIVPSTPRSGEERMFGGAFRTNYPIITTKTNKSSYGAYVMNSGSSQEVALGTNTAPVKNESQVPLYLNVFSDGRLETNLNAYSLVKGKYTILAWLA